MRDNSNDPTPWAVDCPSCKILRFLNEEEYNLQIAAPDDLWTCPVCGQPAEWDDECQASNPPECEQEYNDEDYEDDIPF